MMHKYARNIRGGWQTATFLAVVFLVALCVVGSAEAADRLCYYIPDSAGGSGGWSAATRWKGGVVPTEADDYAVITNCTAVAGAGDQATISAIKGILVNTRDAVIDFNSDADIHVPRRIKGAGKIVKHGTGALYLDATYDFLDADGGIEVNGGEVYFTDTSSTEFTYGPLTVNAPGKLFLRPNAVSRTPGISGDGVITNTSTTARQLVIIANVASRAGTAYAFNGTISPNVQLTFNGAERQDFLSDQTSPLTVRAYAGVAGVSHFGNKNSAGSLGTKGIAMRSNDEPDLFRYLYIGNSETTDKTFEFYSNPTARCTIDGGANGNLVLSGDITMGSIDKMACLYLDGSNTTRCTVSGAIKESTHSSTPHLYLTKRGTGTWRINNNSGTTFKGGVAVEKGVLEADTIKEAGTRCALGYSTACQSRYWTAPDASKNVPYAILLGDGTVPADSVDATIGTLSYVGSADVSVTTRPIAIDGAGRLRNGTERAFSWRGITTKDAEDGVLALDGDGDDNVVSSVTNGAGRISVVKEGSGTWRMEGDFNVSALDVRRGVLDLSVAQNYTYYRFNVKELWSDAQTTFILSRFALLDEDGACVNTNLAYNKSACGNPSRLSPGQWAFWTTDFNYYNTGDGGNAKNIFMENGVPPSYDADCCVLNRSGVKPVLGDESSWFRFIMRVSDSAPAISKYDICASGGYDAANNRPHPREPFSWSVEASRDGVNWTEVSSVVSNSTPTTAAWQWYSTQTATFDSAQNGYAIAPERITDLKPTELDYIAVAAGATLRSDKRISVKELRYDTTRGGGTIEMFSFPVSGTVSVTGDGIGASSVIHLPCTFTNCRNVSNMSRWNVLVNGSPTRHRVKATASGIDLQPDGLLIIVY